MQNKRKYSDFLSGQAPAEPEKVTDPATVQLPEELIDEILLRLPVKSLLRFRCLSKSLSCRIIDPKFINWHLSRSSQSFNLRKMIFPGGESSDAKVCDMNFDLEEEDDDDEEEEEEEDEDEEEDDEDEEKEILRLENQVSLSSKEVYGYCKGLILVAQKPFNQSGFGMWNPSTRQYQDLPDCDFGVPDDLLRESYSIIASGLGFSDIMDDLKAYHAVFMVLFEREDDIEVQVWIYDLESNIWRSNDNLDAFFDELQVPTEHPGISGIGHFTDDCLHWLYTIHNKTEIVAFDMNGDLFYLCPQPVCSIASMDDVETELHVLEGSLCISYYSKPSQADLYMMKKDGDGKFVWTQLYSVTDPYLLVIYWFDRVKVLGYTKSGHKILLDLGRRFLVSYDLEKKSFAEVEIRRDPGCIGSMLSCLCIESLQTVIGGPS